MNLRSMLYRLARWLGDVNAVRKGRVCRRVRNRVVGRKLSRYVRR